MYPSWTRLFGAIGLLVTVLTMRMYGEPISVRFRQGSSHGFLALRTPDGKLIATGESTQTVHGDRVTSRLIFRFRDGSIDDDVTIFTQRDVFRFSQRPPHPARAVIPRTARFPHRRAKWNPHKSGGGRDVEDGTYRLAARRLELTSAQSSGEYSSVRLGNNRSHTRTRAVRLCLPWVSIKPTGHLAFAVGSLRRQATDFTLHVELGGMAGVVAPMIGKQPADYHIWLQSGSPPAFVREEGPLYEGRPHLAHGGDKSHLHPLAWHAGRTLHNPSHTPIFVCCL